MTSGSELSGSRHVSVVTGANRGIGLAVARQLALLHQHVVLAGRNELAMSSAAQDLRSSLGYAHVSAARLNVADGESISEFVGAVRADFGRVDILVNNAAILEDEGYLARNVEPDLLQRTLEVNALGVLGLCQHVIPMMEEQGYGRIVNVSSGWGSVSSLTGGGPPAYKLSKILLNAVTRMLADEVSGDIKINAVDPGWVRTRMGGSVAPRHPDEAADDIVWAATLPVDGPTGGFFYERRPTAW